MNKLLVIIFSSFLAQNVMARENCPTLQTNNHKASGAYIFKQYAFENKIDLVIIDPQAEVKRVTFSRGDATTACFFQPLAFAQGGEGANYWGWHMLWSEPTGLYYARMDGEAWVSSNPKRLTKLAPHHVKFSLKNQQISVTWQQVENNVTSNMQALSSDEGRSWEIAPINQSSD
jgi:hypothetical protein